jgi:enoyl-CoA hydratase
MTIRDLKVPTIAQIHGYCGAAGLMLLAVCDLAMTTKETTFQNPVMRFVGSGVELLLEPWELGFRKGKEFLWTGDKITGVEAEEHGMVNHAVSEDSLEEETMKLAKKLARMPPFALQMSKRSFNFTEDQMGLRDSWKYHLMTHQLVHVSQEWEEYHKEMNEIIEEEGLAEWVKKRDEPFQVDE